MKTFTFVPLFIFLGLLSPCWAQILEQDFDTLQSLKNFAGSTPNLGQVDRINLKPASAGDSIFSLGSNEEGQYLQIEKSGREMRHFDRVTGIDDWPLIKISFNFSVISASVSAKFAAIIVGDSLTEFSQAPAWVERWGQVGIYIDTDNGFFLASEVRRDNRTEISGKPSKIYYGEQRIAIFMNNSGESLLYRAPNGNLWPIFDDAVHIWIGDKLEGNGSAYNGSSATISSVKFLLWNNPLIASAALDDLLICQEVEFIPLPVKLTAFSAKKSGTDVILDWETASEKKSSHFEVERSLDGQQFLKIGKVSAAGNSHTPIDYSFIDLQASLKFAGTLYYRLHQVDIDGSSEYSPIRSVELSAPHTAIRRVYPNPFVEELKVGLLTDKVIEINFRLVNMQGNKVVEEVKMIEPAGEEQILQFTGSDRLPAGMYILEIISAGEKSRYKLVKL